MENIKVTLVKSKIQTRPYCKQDGTFAGRTWKNDIGIQAIPHDIQAVFDMFEKLSVSPEYCMVYGSAIRPMIQNTDRTMMNFEEQPTHLLTLDLDNYKGGLKDVYPTYEEATRETDKFIKDSLPPEFQNTSYILRFSSSFLTKDPSIRCHIIFLLEDSHYPREIGTWIKQEDIPTDPTFYFNLTQPVFTASPVFKDQVDPLDKIDGHFPRVSLVRKEQEVVPAGWQTYEVSAKTKTDLALIPDSSNLPGKMGSFCRMVPINRVLEDLGYEDQGEGRFLSPNSKTGLAGVFLFPNGYCFSHHSDDPIHIVSDQMFYGKRSSFNAYDLAYGWAVIHKDDNPSYMTNFEYTLAESMGNDKAYQDEVQTEFEFRTEWLIEDGYTSENKIIIDTLLFDMSKVGMNEMSRSNIFNVINKKTKKNVKLTELKRAWTSMRKDSAYFKNDFDPDASLRQMADIFLGKGILIAHHGNLNGDYWAYEKGKKLWERLNKTQTDAFVYEHAHEAIPPKVEIDINKMNNVTTLLLKRTCKHYQSFTPGAGWAFKGGKYGIIMDGLFPRNTDNPWKVEKNIVTLHKGHKIYRELPITYDQWKAAPNLPCKFNDFILSSCEEDYEKVDLIQEYMGYVIGDSTYIHSFLILEGVPGSGKSMLNKIMRACIGPRHYAATSLSRIGTPFGLAELPGKKLAVMSEARAVNFNLLQADVPVILKITGGDPIDVEAKHKGAITEMLDCKLMMITNRAPVMPEGTGALSDRILMVKFNKNFRGTKDEILGLDDIIIKTEVPSIVKWSLAGLERLSKRRKFDIPDSVHSEASHYRDQLDPLKGFIEKYFDIVPQADKTKFIKSPEFNSHFQEYLHKIGQYLDINMTRKRTVEAVLRGIDGGIEKRKIRDGPDTYRVIFPLVPKVNLEFEFIEERSEIANTEKGERK